MLRDEYAAWENKTSKVIEHKQADGRCVAFSSFLSLSPPYYMYYCMPMPKRGAGQGKEEACCTTLRTHSGGAPRPAGRREGGL